ncbi:MAG: nuclear transport factor 2 family protein [Minwuiales bacterium]|nr:nuclear transport factor 2 family protein [Minwuiales bacterium]
MADNHESNIDLAERAIDLWLRSKKEILQYLTEDCVYEITPGGTEDVVPHHGIYKGPKGVADFFNTNDDSVETERCSRPPRSQYVAVGDKVVVTGSSTFRIVSSGVRYESYWVLIWTIRDGKIAGLKMLFDEDAARDAWKKSK